MRGGEGQGRMSHTGGMPRTDSLPQLSDRGRGLADIKGHDPMDRRLEVEKKERYAQALREQMAMNAASRIRTPDRDAMSSTSHWGAGSGAGTPGRPSTGFPPSPPPPMPHVTSPPSSTHNGGGGRSRGFSGGGGGMDPHTADRVAEVQDVMRQRIQMLQDEQQRMWQSVQAALQDQMASAREAADRVVREQMQAAQAAHMSEMQKALDQIHEARQRMAAAAQQNDGVAREVDDLRRRVERLERIAEDHGGRLETHTAEIERLKVSHEECARFRVEMQRELRTVSDAVSRFGGELREVSQQSEDSARKVQNFGGEIERLRAARQEDLRVQADLVQGQRSNADAISQLRSDNQEIAHRIGDIPSQLNKLRDEMPRIAAQAARDAVGQLPRPQPAPAPAPPPAQPLFPPEVSEEAFALLRNSDGELYEFPEMRNVVGRSAACTVCVSASQAVSNKHCSVDIDREGKSSIRDLGSRNGTFLNEKRVPQDSGFVISSGDAVRLGADGPTYLFEFGPAYYARWPQEPERVRGSGGGAGGRRGASPSHGGGGGQRGASPSRGALQGRHGR